MGGLHDRLLHIIIAQLEHCIVDVPNRLVLHLMLLVCAEQSHIQPAVGDPDTVNPHAFSECSLTCPHYWPARNAMGSRDLVQRVIAQSKQAVLHAGAIGNIMYSSHRHAEPYHGRTPKKQILLQLTCSLPAAIHSSAEIPQDRGRTTRIQPSLAYGCVRY